MGWTSESSTYLGPQTKPSDQRLLAQPQNVGRTIHDALATKHTANTFVQLFCAHQLWYTAAYTCTYTRTHTYELLCTPELERALLHLALQALFFVGVLLQASLKGRTDTKQKIGVFVGAYLFV